LKLKTTLFLTELGNIDTILVGCVHICCLNMNTTIGKVIIYKVLQSLPIA